MMQKWWIKVQILAVLWWRYAMALLGAHSSARRGFSCPSCGGYLWFPTANQLAQMSHVAIAWAIVYRLNIAGLPLWACGLGVWAWAIPKEFLWDRYGPERDSLVDGVVDWFWYTIGGLVALADLWVTT